MSQRLFKSIALATFTVGMSASADQLPTYAFGPGEQASYKVHYLGITAGSAQITVGAEMTQFGKSVWPIVTLAKTDSVAAVYPVRDKFVTYWDYEKQRTIGNDLFADENRKRRRQRIKMDHDTLKAQVLKQREGHPETEWTLDIAPNALDVAAAAFALRNRDIKVGGKYVYPVFTGDRMFDLVATCEGKVKLETALGEREVLKMRIRTEFSGNLESKRDMYMYLTDDARHLPVRVEADFVLGKVAAEIVDYKQGREIALQASAPGTKAQR